MGFDDRLGFLLLGCLIGFILGRMSKSITEIKEELDEVDDIVKNRLKKDEEGYLRMNIGQVILFLVLALTIYGVIVSQISSNKANHALDRLDNLTNCNQVFLGVTLDALNERTVFSANAESKNIALQKSQHAFLGVLLHQPPPTADDAVQAALHYNAKVFEYIDVSKKSLAKLKENPIPSVKQFSDCVAEAQ